MFFAPLFGLKQKTQATSVFDEFVFALHGRTPAKIGGGRGWLKYECGKIHESHNLAFLRQVLFLKVFKIFLGGRGSLPNKILENFARNKGHLLQNVRLCEATPLLLDFSHLEGKNEKKTESGFRSIKEFFHEPFQNAPVCRHETEKI